MQLLYNRYYVRAASKRAIQRFEREARKIRKNVLKNRNAIQNGRQKREKFLSPRRNVECFFEGEV